MSTFFLFIPPNVGPFTDPVTGETYKPGLPSFDTSDPDQLAAANRIIAGGGGFNVGDLLLALYQFDWTTNITGKPSSYPPSAHSHSADELVSGTLLDGRVAQSNVTQHQAALVLTIAQITGLQAALAACVQETDKGVANGVAALDANAFIPTAQIPGLDASKFTSGVLDGERVPDLPWDKIIEATRPTTLAGYGITDALTETEIGQRISAAMAELVGGAPEALDTLYELAAAFQNNPDVITQLTNAIANKLDASVWQAATAAIDGYMSKEDKAKLDAIEAGATADQTPEEIRAAYEGIANRNPYTDADKSKLDGIEAGATQNAPDANLRDRSTHTGTQAQDTIEDLVSDLADRPLRTELPYGASIEYSSTDDVTDIASGAIVSWNQAVMTDSAFTIGGPNNTEISVAQAGRLAIEARLVYQDTSAEGLDVNNSIGVAFYKNGAPVGRRGVGAAVINANGANYGQAYVNGRIYLEPGDVLTVRTERLSGGDELYLRPGESSLIIDRLAGKAASLATQRFDELSDTPSDASGFTGAFLVVKAGGGVEYKLTVPITAIENLVATLGNKADLVGGKIPTAQIPALALTRVDPVADIAARDALDVQEGDVCVVASEGKSYIYDGASWLEINAAAPVQSVNGQTGVVVLGKADVELGEVDNTSDADKPVSTAQAAAIAERQAISEKNQANGYAGLGADGKLARSLLPDDIGGGLKVETIQDSAFTPLKGSLYPVQGGVTLASLMTDPAYGDECALVAHDTSWTPAAPLTLPGSDAAPVNGKPYDLIITAPSYVAIRYAGENYGFEVTVIALDQSEYSEPHVGAPTITSPADAATDIIESPTLTASAFAPVNAPGETHTASDWQVATDSDFASIVVQSADDAANLESWKVPAGNLAVSTTYHARVRYAGATYGDSLWSDPISFTTASAFLDGDAQAIIDQMSTAPSSARQLLIDDLVAGLKADGLWSKLLALWVPAAHDAQAARLNWKDPAGVSLAPINAPIFTVDEGYKGDGASAYLDTGVAPSSYPAYATGSASLGVVVGPGSGALSGVLMGVNDRSTGAETASVLRFGGGKYRAAVNSQGETGNSSADGAVGDLVIATKTDTSANTPIYLNGSLDSTGSASSVRPPEQNMFLLCQQFDGNPNSFTTAQISLAFIGTGLTATDAANLDARISAYMTGL